MWWDRLATVQARPPQSARRYDAGPFLSPERAPSAPTRAAELGRREHRRRVASRASHCQLGRLGLRFAMSPTIVDRGSAPEGVVFRRTPPGPEQDLVERFIHAMPLVHAPDSRVTVLREPGLESGFPDLVIVVWRDARTADWDEPRLALVPDDLRLMHYVFQRRRAAHSELEDHFGSRFARSSVERLHGARLLRPAGRAWFPRALERTFAATKIIAVEAKIGKWADVLNQARLNTWFASKSYVLVPRVSEKQVQDARRFGIGVLFPEQDGISEWGASTAPLPRSYASWVVNDLAWRASKEHSNRGSCPTTPK